MREERHIHVERYIHLEQVVKHCLLSILILLGMVLYETNMMEKMAFLTRVEKFGQQMQN